MSTSPTVVTIGSSSRSSCAGRGPQQRAHLGAQQPGPVERQPDGAPAERRVLLLRLAQIGQHLVAADVEGAEHDRLAARPRSTTVRYIWVCRSSRGNVADIMNCSSVRNRPMPSAPDSRQVRDVHLQAGIDVQLDALAVLGDGGLVAQRAVLALPPRPKARLVAIGGDDLARSAGCAPRRFRHRR